MTTSLKIVDEWIKSWKNLGWHTYRPLDDEYEAKYRHINVSMEGNWKVAYTYGMVWMKEFSTSLDIDYRLECLAIVYAMLKACDRRLVSLESWDPLFCCPSGHQLKTLITQIVGSNDPEAIEWFTASVVDTGKQILLSESDQYSKLSDDLIDPDERIAEAVKQTFWRLDEGMFRSALVLHAWLRCGQKVSIDDPAMILGAVHASMIHDALSLLRDSSEAQDKSPASILKISRAVYGQTILSCVKLGDIAMRNVCDTNLVWTVLGNFSDAHLLLNTTSKEYGVAEKMGVPTKNLLDENGACIPQMNQTVVDYYCAVVRAASRNRNLDMPWKGNVDGGLKWLNEANHIVSSIKMEPGRPAYIRSKLLVQYTRPSTPIGRELFEAAAGARAAILGYYSSTICFPNHFDIRFVEAVAVLYAKLESGAIMRDGGPKMPGSLCTLPQDLVEKAWNAIASLTSCNDRHLKLLKDTYDQSCLLRSTDAVRTIAKAAQEYSLQSDTDTIPSPYYSKYVELRLIDGYWVLGAMLNLLYETGKPEDANSHPFRKLLEASLVRLEESSRIRRIVDDEGYGYWSCLSREMKRKLAKLEDKEHMCSGGKATAPLLKTPLSQAQQAYSAAAATYTAVAGMRAAAYGAAAAAQPVAGYAAVAGYGREYADPYLGHGIGPVPGYGAAMYRGSYNRFAPY